MSAHSFLKLPRVSLLLLLGGGLRHRGLLVSGSGSSLRPSLACVTRAIKMRFFYVSEGRGVISWWT